MRSPRVPCVFLQRARVVGLLPLLMLAGGLRAGAIAHLWCGKDPDRRGNPCLGYLHQSYRRGAPAWARNRRGRRARLSAERVRGVPRADGDRWPRSQAGKTRRGARCRPLELGANTAIRAPYATVVWDYINRGMPLNREGTLTADEVYALTAYLLYLNDLVPEDKVLDAQSLPRVEMPNRDAWAALPDWKPGMPRLPGYPY